MYYFIGYINNNDWSTSEIPLDRYQEKLQERILSDFNELELSKKIQLLKDESLVKAKEEELQHLINEKDQLQEDQHQLLLRDKEQQEREEQLKTSKATLVLQLQEANTLLQQAEKYKEELQKELKEERQLSSGLMKQKGKQVTASEKDEIIELLTTKLDDEKKENKKLKQELQEKVESLEQQLQQFIIPQSGMCVCLCTGSRYDVSVFQI